MPYQHLHVERLHQPVQLFLRPSVWNPDHESWLSSRLHLLRLRFSKLRLEVHLKLRHRMRLRQRNLCEQHIGHNLRDPRRRHILPLPQVRPDFRRLTDLRLSLPRDGARLHQLDLLSMCDVLPSCRQVYPG